MSKVNVYTYEMYLLDFFESKLDAADTQELLHFLRQHPELDVDLATNPIDVYALPSDEIFVGKGALLKNERIDTFSDLVIAEMEGCGTPEELNEKKELIAMYPHLKREEELFRKTRLEADLAIRFNRKELILQTNKGLMPQLRYWIGAAASVLFLMAVYFFNQRKPIAGTAYAKHVEQPVSNDVNITEAPTTFAVNQTVVSSAAEKSKKSKVEKRNESQSTTIAMEAIPLNTFSPERSDVVIPKAKKPSQEEPSSTYMAMGEDKLDIQAINTQMEKLFADVDTTDNGKKGFTIRIGKLVLLHFGPRKNKP